MSARKLVSFDWAVKRLLRSKANFGVLEGFLSELLKDDILILEVLESESNKDTRDQHLTRVDLLVKNSVGALVIISPAWCNPPMAEATAKVKRQGLEKGLGKGLHKGLSKGLNKPGLSLFAA